MTKDDKQKIRTVIEQFAEVYQEMETIESELITLEKRRTEVIDRVKSIREAESKLLEEMREKYGDVTLDLEKMEIIK
jgi:predicted nuclease with TOPRIM domain